MAAMRARATSNEADEPSSPVLRFGADQPLQLDAGVAAVAVPDRLPDLWRR